MDGTLVLITLVSLGTTGGVLLYAARLIRDERARSNARVAALAEEIARVPHAPLRDATPGDRPAAPIARSSVRPRTAPARSADAPLPAPGLSPAGLLLRDETSDAGPAAPVGGMFESPIESSANRWLIPVIGAAIVALALATIYIVSGQPGARPSATAAAASGDTPLELASLGHAREGDTLTVSGVVRNPSAGTERRQVSVVVFLFDRTGSFVASGRAPLDYQALAAGAESPFVVTVPQAGTAIRYRVSFRAGADVLPHVDRREPAGAADAARARP
jgi:hypothetical protein